MRDSISSIVQSVSPALSGMVFLLCLGALCLPLTAVMGSPRVLIVVGPSQHPPGTHEVAAGGRLLEHCLESLQNAEPFQVDLVEAWPGEGADFSVYDTVVFIGDRFPVAVLPDRERVMKDLSTMMASGCGMVTIHYATGLTGEDIGADPDHPLLHWTGGYAAFYTEHHASVARVYEATEIVPADPQNPISRGVPPFTLHDEPYINIYFGLGEEMIPGAFPVATSQLPPENPTEQVIAWGIERPDGGRGVGVTLPHFYKNWRVEPMRRLILNSILWSAKVEVPEKGADTVLPDLASFGPESVMPLK